MKTDIVRLVNDHLLQPVNVWLKLVFLRSTHASYIPPSHWPFWWIIIHTSNNRFKFHSARFSRGKTLGSCSSFSSRNFAPYPRHTSFLEMASKEIELWNRACEKCKIPSAVANYWLNRILQKYDTESQRCYHNSQILRSKSELIAELDATTPLESIDILVFAMFFQYFEFDVKSNCCEKNCDAFRQFCDEANVTDVSTPRSKYRWMT